MMASIFFAFREGIRESKSLPTQVHFTLIREHNSLPKSISKPTKSPFASFDENGA
ncbi:Uncharacterised protein [Klebsiella pneumoniae]|nr:Uncharacterised protein [Klebsiella pneumoniae]